MGLLPSRAETNTANTQILVKDFGNRIVKLVLEYSLRSHEPAHIMFLSKVSDTVSFCLHNFLSEALTSVL